MDAKLEYSQREAGMYHVTLIGQGPAVRLSLITGSSGSWYAEASDSTSVTSLKCFRTRKEAGERLYLYFMKRSQASRLPGTS